MKRLLSLPILSVLMLASVAFADAEKLIATAADKSKDALAVFRYSSRNELGERTMGGQAICVREDGLFITLSVNPGASKDAISDATLIEPGLGGKSFKAELIGVDRETGIAFVRCLDSQKKWSAIEFASKAELNVGQGVASAGLMPEEAGYARYFGTACVSSMIRIPEKQIYVAGGKLTGVGSPVFTADGKAIGLVQRQQYQPTQMVINRQPVNANVANQFETSFFMPAEEFAHVLASGGKMRTPSWIGVLDFQSIGKDVAGVLNLDRPSVLLDKVIPNGPAAKAGVKNRDVVVGLGDHELEALGTPELTAGNLYRTISMLPGGQQVKLTIVRDGKTLTVTLTTEEMPPTPADAPRFFSQVLGLGVRNRVMLDEFLIEGLSAKASGVLVYLAIRDLPAQKADLRSNDLIVSADGIATASTETFQKIVEKALADKNAKDLKVEVMRGDKKESLLIPLPKR